MVSKSLHLGINKSRKNYIVGESTTNKQHSGLNQVLSTQIQHIISGETNRSVQPM